MNLNHERSEQLRFMVRGVVRIWALFLAIGVPFALFISLAVWIGHHSFTGTLIFAYGSIVTFAGAFYGYFQFERKRDQELADAKHAKWEAEQAAREAVRKAEQTAREAEQAAREAVREAEQAAREAEQAAREAEREKSRAAWQAASGNRPKQLARTT